MFIILEKLPKSINEFRDIRRCNNETNTMWVHLSSINQKNVEKIEVVQGAYGKFGTGETKDFTTLKWE